MEPEGSLLCSQQPAADLYTEPSQFAPYPLRFWFKIPFNNILTSRAKSAK
jgi:hypothetical protein